jgi:hypothetical protein
VFLVAELTQSPVQAGTSGPRVRFGDRRLRPAIRLPVPAPGALPGIANTQVLQNRAAELLLFREEAHSAGHPWPAAVCPTPRGRSKRGKLSRRPASAVWTDLSFDRRSASISDGVPGINLTSQEQSLTVAISQQKTTDYPIGPTGAASTSFPSGDEYFRNNLCCRGYNQQEDEDVRAMARPETKRTAPQLSPRRTLSPKAPARIQEITVSLGGHCSQRVVPLVLRSSPLERLRFLAILLRDYCPVRDCIVECAWHNSSHRIEALFWMIEVGRKIAWGEPPACSTYERMPAANLSGGSFTSGERGSASCRGYRQ